MIWQSGDTLKNGAYTVEKVLRQGRFGLTYLARSQKDRLVAIKTLNLDSPFLQNMTAKEKKDLEAKFCDEAVKLAKCNHPHIVEILELFQEQKSGFFGTTRHWCMVMEYIDGKDLSDRATPILPQGEALRYIRQIGEALIAVHNMGLFHRDIKPANIMLRRKAGKTAAVLIDFGLARAFEHPLTQQIASDGFAPIELYSQDLKCGTWSDVYGLSATLYELLTGKVPEKSLDCHDRDRNIDLTSPIHYNSRMSKRVNRAILKGMALMPRDRVQTIPEFLRLLGVRGWFIPFPQWNVDRWVQIGIMVGTGLAAIAALLALFLN